MATSPARQWWPPRRNRIILTHRLPVAIMALLLIVAKCYLYTARTEQLSRWRGPSDVAAARKPIQERIVSQIPDAFLVLQSRRRRQHVIPDAQPSSCGNI